MKDFKFIPLQKEDIVLVKKDVKLTEDYIDFLMLTHDLLCDYSHERSRSRLSAVPSRAGNTDSISNDEEGIFPTLGKSFLGSEFTRPSFIPLSIGNRRRKGI